MRIRLLLFLLIIWRILLFIYLILGKKFIPQFTLTFLHPELVINRAPDWLWPWANFDGAHYINIALNGYQNIYSPAFFPLYPLLIRAVNYLFSNPIISGLVISHICLFIALLLLIKLCNILKLSAHAIQSLLIVYLLFPVSYYLGSVYTESLFLMLSIATFYFGYQKRWFFAGIAGGLASIARVNGVILFPSLVILWWIQNRSDLNIKTILQSKIWWLILILAGLIGYMLYLQINFNDPIYFIHAHQFFGEQRQLGFIFLPQIIWRYLKMFNSIGILTPTFYALSLEFVVGILFFILSIWVWMKLGPVLGFYTLVNYLIPTFTGSFWSMPRIVLLLFPAFIVLTQLFQNYKKIKWIYFIISPILLAISTVFFTRGLWIA